MEPASASSSDQPAPDSPKTTSYERRSCFHGERRVLDESHKVMRAYNAALGAYNQENWDASVVLSGKVLENIARSELSFHDQGGNLSQLVEKLIKAINSNQPLVDLATTLKQGNGLASHFDLEKESNSQIAEVTLDVIECFISYLYIFRLRLHQLKELMEPATAGEATRAPNGRQVDPSEVESLTDPSVVPNYDEVQLSTPPSPTPNPHPQPQSTPVSSDPARVAQPHHAPASPQPQPPQFQP